MDTSRGFSRVPWPFKVACIQAVLLAIFIVAVGIYVFVRFGGLSVPVPNRELGPPPPPAAKVADAVWPVVRALD